jgi:type I restriction enzyme S subunit
MTTKFQMYPKYKPSGVDWLGDIPVGWDVRRFKGLFVPSDERVGDDPSIDLPLSVSGYRGVEPRDVSSMEGQMPSDDVTGYRIVRKGQLAVNTMWLNFSGLGVSEYEGYISPAYRSYDITPDVYPRYAHHLLRSILYVQKYTSLLYGVRPNSLQIKTNDFERIEILLPPIETQKRIANFLDANIKVIDELIAKKERLIELLREKRAVLITHVVTKGLNPNVKLKPSSVDWLGHLPEEWKTKPLKFLFSYHVGGTWGDEARQDGHDLICVRVADFDFLKLVAFSEEYTLRNLPDIKEFLLLDESSILLEKSGGGDQSPVGRAVRYSGREKATCSNFIQKLQVDKKYNPEFVVFVLSALYFTGVTGKAIKQTTGIQNLDIDFFLRTSIFYPQLEEQRRIAQYLREKSDRMIEAIQKNESQIKNLEEYRSSLIFSAVTGKIKI